MFTYVEDFETSNIEHTNVVVTFRLCVQGSVYSLYQPIEHSVVQGLGNGAHRVGHLVFVTPLDHKLVTDLDLWLQQTLQQVTAVDAE